jgi:hypothetical protein
MNIKYWLQIQTIETRKAVNFDLKAAQALLKILQLNPRQYESCPIAKGQTVKSKKQPIEGKVI